MYVRELIPLLDALISNGGFTWPTQTVDGVWMDFTHTGPEQGCYDEPFDSILDLGNVYNIADVTINGKQLAYGLWAPPFRVNVKDALRADDNLLTVKVTNAWYNRLLAEARLKPEERRTWSTVYPTGQPRPAGLIGPVKLLIGADYIEPSN